MPITRVQFDLGISESDLHVMHRVYDFLSSNSEQAFSPNEIGKELDLPADTILFALENLEVLGAIEGRSVRDTDFYACTGPFPNLSNV